MAARPRSIALLLFGVSFGGVSCKGHPYGCFRVRLISAAVAHRRALGRRIFDRNNAEISADRLRRHPKLIEADISRANNIPPKSPCR